MNVGERLRKLREDRGLSQQEISAALKINRTTYVKYETGASAPTRQLQQLANFFDVSIDYLLGNNKPISNTTKIDTSPEDLELLRQIKNLPARDRKVLDLLLDANLQEETGTK